MSDSYAERLSRLAWEADMRRAIRWEPTEAENDQQTHPGPRARSVAQVTAGFAIGALAGLLAGGLL